MQDSALEKKKDFKDTASLLSVFAQNHSLSESVKKEILDRIKSLDVFNFDWSNKKVLDLASGWPLLPTFISRTYDNSDVTCVDLSGPDEEFKKMMGDNYLTGDVAQLKFEDSSFDIIVSTLGVPHIFLYDKNSKISQESKDLVRASILEAHRCVKVGGEVRLSISQEDNISVLNEVLNKISSEVENFNFILKPLFSKKNVLIIKKNK